MSKDTPEPDLGAPCLPATWGHLRMVLAALEEEEAHYVLVGGFAMNLLGFSRQTGDIDILVEVSVENNARWIAALSRMPDGAACELQGVDNPFAPDNSEDMEEYSDGVIRIHDAFIIDVMPRACGVSYEDIQDYSMRAEYDGIEFNMLNAEGMLLTKRGARPKDITDRNWLTINFKRLMASLNKNSDNPSDSSELGEPQGPKC